MIYVAGGGKRHKSIERELTSYDELFHSQLNEESELLASVDVHTSDPQRVRRVEFATND